MILRAENIAKNYNGRQVVKEISLEVKQGEIIGYWVPMVQVKPPLFI